MNDDDFELTELINLAEAARLIPSPYKGKHTSPATLRRWIRQGKLRGVRRGNNTFTTRRWIEALFEPAGQVPVDPRPALSPAQEGKARREVSAWSKKVLEEAGI